MFRISLTFGANMSIGRLADRAERRREIGYLPDVDRDTQL
jgi:hypothetical protein